MSTVDFDLDDDGVELSDNRVESLVEYTRGSVIKNESQSVILLLGWLTGWFASEERYMNQVVIGGSSGGKTHLVRKLKELVPENQRYESTSSSEKGFVDDADWEGTRVAVLSEWQKLGGQIREFMKSVAGDDGGYEYARSVPDEDGEKGDRKTKKLTKESKPYSFTYAQFSMDYEMWTRLFKNYVEESREINRAVARMHAGHENITLDGAFENEYIYDTVDLKLELQDHVRTMPTDAYVHMPAWVFHAVEPTLDLGSSESKRVSAMVFNLIRASALFNYDERETTTLTIGDHERDAYVVEPQDVANVLSCREVLLGTTHGLEPRKQAIIQAVRTKAEMKPGDENVVLLEDIHEYLSSEETETSAMSKEYMRELLEELDEDFVIKKHERYEGNAHGYEFLSLSHIDVPRLTDFTNLDYESDDPFVGVADADDPFADCRDPLSGQSFKESVEEFRKDIVSTFSGPMDTGAAMGGPDPSEQTDDTSDDSGRAQQTLGGGTADDDSVDAEPEGHVEQHVYERLHDFADGQSFSPECEHEHVLGIVDEGETVAEASVDGTMLDPSEDVWERPDDTRIVDSRGEARKEIERAYESLCGKGIVRLKQTNQGNVAVRVVDV